MKINRADSFSNQEKKLKKYQREKDIYDKVINHIKQCNTIDELEKHPISKMYGYEALKGDLNKYSSFNLCKNREIEIIQIFATPSIFANNVSSLPRPTLAPG